MMKPFVRVQTSDSALSRVQDGAEATFKSLNQGIPAGVQLPNVTLLPGSNTINHTLGRVLQGWFFVRFRGLPGQIYDTQDANPTPDKTLLLTSPGGVLVDIWVY